jgi:lipopolysaccharide export LptBFGC system permease protein LptF
MLLFALTTIEKLKQVPKSFWINILVVVLGLIAAVFVLRKIKQMNKIVIGIILAVVFVLVGFNWIYERNEPKFLSPLVDMIAPFLPAKGSYGPVKPH